MATDKSFAQMLTEAADYLERPDVLLYKASGVIDDDGNLVHYGASEPDPICACAVTALMRTYYEYQGALEIFADTIGIDRGRVMKWNDEPERRKADVVRAFRTAAARAEVLS